MAFGFLSHVLHGDSKPGGGVFGFLNQTAQGIVNPVSKVANEARVLPAVVTGNQKAAQNILRPGGGFGHQGGILGGAELGNDAVFAGPQAIQNIKKTAGTAASIAPNLIAPGLGTGETLLARVGSGAIKSAPLGFLGTLGQQVGNDQPIDLKQLAEGTAGAAILGGAAPIVRQAGHDLRTGNEIGAIGKNVDGIVPPKPNDIHIQTPEGSVRIAHDEMQALQKATTPGEVKSIIGDVFPKPIVDRLSVAIPGTKDPHIISNIISKELSPSPPPVSPEINPTPVTPTPEAAGQGDLNNLGQSEAAQRIMNTLGEARKTRELQTQSYSAERSARAGIATGASKNLTGTEAYRAKLAQLEGPLAKQEYQGLSGHLSPTQKEADFTDLSKEIEDNPNLDFYGKLNTQTAIRKVIFGEKGVPTPSELGLLEKQFGSDFANQVKEDIAAHNEKVNAMKTFGQKVTDVTGLPRTLETTLDFSGGFRQGLVAATRHPIIFAKNFGKQFGYAFSEDKYNAAQKIIEDDPNFHLMQQSKLAIQRVGNAPLGDKEEAFISSLAERIPGIGKVVHASNRAYTGLLNNMRAEIFNQLAYTARSAGHDLESPESLKLIKDIAKVVNYSTGRGDLGRLESASQALTALAFSPRLVASRLALFDFRPTSHGYYWNLEPIARKEALQSLASLGAFGLTVLGAAELAGAKVSKDPTNADFGKARIGDTRLDVLGGFSQYIRLGAQLIEGKKTSSTTGATTELGKGIASSRWDVFTDFLTNKEAPVPSFVTGALKSSENKPFVYKNEIINRMSPLIAQDIHDLWSHPGGGGGSSTGRIGSAVAGTFGVGTQTYSAQDNPLSQKQKTYIDNLKSQGADKDTIKASTAFFQNLKEASGTRTNVNTAVDKALAENDLPKAQRLAEQYNKELAAGIHDWNEKYGRYATSDLQDAYNRQKINLSPTSINSRLQSIHSTKPF